MWANKRLWMDTISDLYFTNNFMANDYDFVVNLAYKLDFKIIVRKGSERVKTTKYKEFDISIEKYGFSDGFVVWNYYICTISNNNDRYYMVFLDDGLTENEALKQCTRRLDYKNKCKVKFTVKNIYEFIKEYEDEINRLKEDFDVEIREV